MEEYLFVINKKYFKIESINTKFTFKCDNFRDIKITTADKGFRKIIKDLFELIKNNEDYKLFDILYIDKRKHCELCKSIWCNEMDTRDFPVHIYNIQHQVCFSSNLSILGDRMYEEYPKEFALLINDCVNNAIYNQVSGKNIIIKDDTFINNALW